MGEVTNIDFDLSTLDEFGKQLVARKGYRKLPSGIESIVVVRVNETPESWNSWSEGAIGIPFGHDHLKSILDSKEQLLKKYQYCDEFWLVIKEGSYAASYFGNIDLKLPIVSDLDKVFLLRSSEGEIIEFK